MCLPADFGELCWRIVSVWSMWRAGAEVFWFFGAASSDLFRGMRIARAMGRQHQL